MEVNKLRIEISCWFSGLVLVLFNRILMEALFL